MRLAESDIVAGLGHPNIHVREVVAQYLEECGRTQVDITRELIAAVKRFGWEDVLEYPYRVSRFKLDAATLEWALGEIEREGEGRPGGEHTMAFGPHDCGRAGGSRAAAAYADFGAGCLP